MPGAKVTVEFCQWRSKITGLHVGKCLTQRTDGGLELIRSRMVGSPLVQGFLRGNLAFARLKLPRHEAMKTLQFS